MKKPPLPLVGRGLLRAYLILFRRDVDEDQVGVLAWLEAMFAFLFTAFLFTVLRGLIDVWPFKGPVVLPTLVAMTAFTFWWLARFNNLIDATGPLSKRSAKRGFTGHAALFWQSWLHHRCQKGMDEWTVLLLREPLMLVMAGVLLMLVWLPAGGVLLLAIALSGSIQTIRDRKVDRAERETAEQLSRDHVAVFGGGADVVDAEDEEYTFHVQDTAQEHAYIDEDGVRQVYYDEPIRKYVRDWKLKKPVPRGTSSAPILVWPSVVLTVLVASVSLNLSVGDPLGLYRFAPTRLVAAAQSIDRELAVLGLGTGGPDHSGVHDAMLKQLDPDAWASHEAQRAMSQAELRLNHQVQTLDAELDSLRSLCESMPGDLELAPGPAPFHTVLLQDRSLASDWALIVRGLPQVEADVAAVRRAIRAFNHAQYSNASDVAQAEASAREQLDTINQTISSLRAAHRRVAFAIQS